jgi:hypothetical protein
MSSHNFDLLAKGGTVATADAPGFHAYAGLVDSRSAARWRTSESLPQGEVALPDGLNFPEVSGEPVSR